ncbi:MAG: nitroreductase family protein [Actinomycetota bacterium]|nr:nitroreductase family protein [Actinomycetota bacterium]
MSLYEAMRTTSSCRYFTDEPVSDGVIHRILDHARFASSGGNRQGWRIMVVTEPEQRHEVGELHRRQWDPYYQHALEGHVGYQGDGSGKKMEHGTDFAVNRLKRTDDFAQAIDDVPVLMCCYVELSTLAVTDKDLGRQSVVGGGSLYTFIQNILLACTHEGLGSSLTTLLAAEQPDVDKLFDAPDGYALGALIAVGWPVRDKLYTKLTRKPVEEIAFRGKWGEPFQPE